MSVKHMALRTSKGVKAMHAKSSAIPVILLSLLLGAVISLPAFAGSAVVGSVAANINATLSGAPILPYTTIASGERLEVRDGVAIVSTDHGGLLTLGRQTTVSFLREAEGVAAVLSSGTVTLRHPAASRVLVIKAGEMEISPAAGMRTEGEIASLDGTLLVTTQEGVLRVQANGQEVEVGKGKMLTLTTRKAQATLSPSEGSGGGSGLAADRTAAPLRAFIISDADTAAAIAARSDIEGRREPGCPFPWRRTPSPFTHPLPCEPFEGP